MPHPDKPLGNVSWSVINNAWLYTELDRSELFFFFFGRGGGGGGGLNIIGAYETFFPLAPRWLFVALDDR